MSLSCLSVITGLNFHDLRIAASELCDKELIIVKKEGIVKRVDITTTYIINRKKIPDFQN